MRCSIIRPHGPTTIRGLLPRSQLGSSRPVRPHRDILKERLKAVGLSHAAIAKAMGWKSPATAGHKLRGRNDWAEGELVKICGLAGLTLLELSEQSSDLPLGKNQDTTRAARLYDALPDEKRAKLLALIEEIAGASAIERINQK